MEDLKLHDAVVFLAAAGVVVPLVKRFRLSPVLGFMLIGLAVGPYGLAHFTEDFPWLRLLLITDVDGVIALAELGVVFLLFMIGLELSIERLLAMRRLVFGMGFLQIGITGIAIGSIAFAFGNSIEASMVLGACLALSSTAIVIQLLTEQGRFGSTVGRGSFAILLSQDIAVVPILFLVGTFGVHAGGSLTGALLLALGEAVLAVVLILGIGRLIVRPLFRFVGSSNSPELFMAITLLLIIATAAATHAAGMSAALGAFLAGLLLAETEFRHEIEINIEPFKGLLLGLFFMSVTMGIDLREIAAQPLLIGVSIIGLFVLKAAIITVLARLFAYSWGQALEMALLLAQGGEFAFVVVGLALGYALLPVETAQFMLIVVGATMLLTPALARVARRLGTTFASAPDTSVDNVAPELAGHVIIVGYGRTGQLLARLLNQQRIPHVALDLDGARVSRLSSEGAPVFFGDASRATMLERVHLTQAAALAVCTDDPDATLRVIDAAQRVAPTVPVVARAHDGEHALRLLAGGATLVAQEVLESGLQLGTLLFDQLGVPAPATRELIDTQRSEARHGKAGGI